MKRYHPFCGAQMMHMPTIYQYTDNNAGIKEANVTILPPHPAAIGLEYIFTVLTATQMYCI